MSAELTDAENMAIGANCNCTLQQQFRRMQHSPHRRTKIYTEFVITLRLIYITESNRVILEYVSNLQHYQLSYSVMSIWFLALQPPYATAETPPVTALRPLGPLILYTTDRVTEHAEMHLE